MTVFALMFGETITRMRFVATRFTSVSSNNFFRDMLQNES